MQTRRETLKRSAIVAGLLATTGLFPQYALAYNKGAFEAKTIADALKALGCWCPGRKQGCHSGRTRNCRKRCSGAANHQYHFGRCQTPADIG